MTNRADGYKNTTLVGVTDGASTLVHAGSLQKFRLHGAPVLVQLHLYAYVGSHVGAKCQPKTNQGLASVFSKE